MFCDLLDQFEEQAVILDDRRGSERYNATYCVSAPRIIAKELRDLTDWIDLPHAPSFARYARVCTIRHEPECGLHATFGQRNQSLQASETTDVNKDDPDVSLETDVSSLACGQDHL